MKELIPTTALIAALAFMPSLANASNFGNAGFNPHEQCKRDEDNRQILGGLAGAVLGGVIGSQVAGRGARTEGSFIAGTIGALAGAGIADKSIDCDPVYTGPQTYSGVRSVPVTSQKTYPSSSYSSSYSGPTYSNGSAQSSYGNPVSYSARSARYDGAQTYEDRVTVSNHPVYSDPHYGAGAVSQGSTYSAGTISYPPSGNNSQYVQNTPQNESASVYNSAPVYAPRTVSQTYASSAPRTHYASSYHQASHAPVVRVSPRRVSRSFGRHYHGRYSCDMGH